MKRFFVFDKRRLTISRPFQPPRGPQASEGPRVNEAIRAPKVRLINETGENVGIVSVQEALAMAREVDLDLVEISPNVEPPVCKIMNYGKYKFEMQKKKAAERKNQKIIETKEIKLRPTTEEHDYQTKLRAIKRFLEDGDKVKISMRFRGRELDHVEIGMTQLKRIIGDVGDLGRVESQPKLEGRNMGMMISSTVKK